MKLKRPTLLYRCVFTAFGLAAFGQVCIVLFDGRLFEYNQIMVYNLNTQYTSIEEIVTPEDVMAIKDELKDFARQIEEEQREAQEAQELVEMFDEDELILDVIPDATGSATRAILDEMKKADEEDDAA